MADASTAQLTEFLLPDLGEEIEEADVLQVHVALGDMIVLEQAILEIETEKATLDLPSSVVGTITAIHVGVGDTIRTGDRVLTVSGSQPTAFSAKPPAPRPAHTPAPLLEQLPAPVGPPIETAPSEPQTDVVAPPTQLPVARPPLLDGEPDQRPVFASPSVRRFAREIGVEISSVVGNGPGGRISEDDVKLHARNRPLVVQPVVGARHVPAPLPDFAEFGPIERVKLTRLRRTIKRNMTAAWHEIPHVTLQHTADITDLEQVRRQYRPRAQQAGGNLTVTAIMLKIVASALRAHPHVNSSLDAENDELILKRFVHLGVAVDTPRGLVVPVIRDVDRKNIIQLADRADGRLRPGAQRRPRAGRLPRQQLHSDQPGRDGDRLLHAGDSPSERGDPRDRARGAAAGLGATNRSCGSRAASCRSRSRSTIASWTAPTGRAS